MKVRVLRVGEVIPKKYMISLNRCGRAAGRADTWRCGDGTLSGRVMDQELEYWVGVVEEAPKQLDLFQ